jgi:hypothetical protein
MRQSVRLERHNRTFIALLARHDWIRVAYLLAEDDACTPCAEAEGY